MSPSPFRKHQSISREIEFRLCQWVETHPLGEVYDAPFDVVLSQYDIVQPDILYISYERKSILIEANVQGAPDLVRDIQERASFRIPPSTWFFSCPGRCL